MRVPNWVHDQAIIMQGENSGHFTAQWEVYINQLETELQNNYSDEGTVIPEQSTDNIDIIAAAPQSQNGIRLVFDNNTNELKAIVNGAVKTVTLT